MACLPTPPYGEAAQASINSVGVPVVSLLTKPSSGCLSRKEEGSPDSLSTTTTTP